MVLATKFGLCAIRTDPAKRGVNGRPEYVISACEAALRRLGVDHIDLYYQHRVDPDVPIEETVGAMAELVARGQGPLTSASRRPARRRSGGRTPCTRSRALQTEYSLWSRDIEDEILPTIRELGIGLVAYSPLGRGFLTGRFQSPDDLGDGDFRRYQPRFQGDNFARNLQLVEGVKELAREHNCTPAQLALAWVMNQSRPPDIVPIPGTKRRSYLEQNVEATEITLSAEDLQRIDDAAPADGVAGDRYADMSFVNR